MIRTAFNRTWASLRMSRGRLLATLLPWFVLAGSGCKMVQDTANLPMNAVSAVVPTSKSGQPDPAVLQAKLLGYADDFFARTSMGTEEYSRRVNTPKARSEALSWKVSLDSSALDIATGSNPEASLLDFLALATLSRTFLEARATHAVPPDAFDPWLEDSRVLETNAWKLAEGVLTTGQQDEFRAAMKAWVANNAGTDQGFFRRPQELASGVRLAGEKAGTPGSVFSLVGLDPMSGLDPAVREMTRTRLFAERALFAAQRMPFLLRWQTDLLAEHVLGQEQLTNAVASADRLSRAAESVSQTAALLPDRITAERKAILDALDKQEGRLRDLSAEVDRTLVAGDKMSTSLNTTLVTFDALMKRFGVGEPSTTPPDTNSPPFNILDYAHTADQIAAMAQQLDMLIKDASGTVATPALDKRIAELNALSGRARTDAKSVLNHAFLLAAGLIVLLFAGAVVYRRAGRPSPKS
jgi:hypothetical protein